MGSSSYSDDFYKDRVRHRAATSTPTFVHDHAVRSGTAASALHPTLDIRGKIREARDSAAHPESTPIGVIFDVTGSMADVPRTMQSKLPQLMGLLLRKGYIEHPQILFGAIGDYPYRDDVPLQIGQFESGIEMDDNITHIYLEGGGGGSSEESYQNALYFFAHRTSCDAWEKRGKKGYLFLIGDEKPYDRVPAKELKDTLGIDVQGDVRIEDIMSAVLEKWHVFFIIPKGTNHYNDRSIRDRWSELVGAQHVIMLDEPAAVCETIGLTIGLLEGTATPDGMHADLKDIGTSHTVIASATRGLDALAKSTALAKSGTGDLPAKATRSTTTERL